MTADDAADAAGDDDEAAAAARAAAEAERAKRSGAEGDFKISVCVRFRPRAADDDVDPKLALPLHQFLKLKRRQQKEQASAPRDAARGGAPLDAATARQFFAHERGAEAGGDGADGGADLSLIHI